MAKAETRISTETRISNLFNELVPKMGKADTVAGEIIRAISRIAYREFNDGDHIGVGYGNHTCNAPARYLMEHCDAEIARLIRQMWGVDSFCKYDDMLGELEEKVLSFVDGNPNLRELENTCDMLDYHTPEDEEKWLYEKILQHTKATCTGNVP